MPRIMIELHDVSINSNIHWSGMQTDIGWIHYLLATSNEDVGGLLGPFLLHTPCSLKNKYNPAELAYFYGLIQSNALLPGASSRFRILRLLRRLIHYYRYYLKKRYKILKLPDSLKEDIYAHYISRFDRFEDFLYKEKEALQKEQFFITGLPRNVIAFLRTHKTKTPPVSFIFKQKPKAIIFSDVYKLSLDSEITYFFRIPDWIPFTHPTYVGGSNLITARYNAVRHLIKEHERNRKFFIVAYTKTVAEQTQQLFPEIEKRIYHIPVVIPSGYRKEDDKQTQKIFLEIITQKTRNFNNNRKEAILKNLKKTLNKTSFIITGLAAIEPRKNFRGIIKAFRIFLLRLPYSQRQNVFLIIKGGAGWKEQDLLSEIREIHNHFNLIYIDKVLEFEELRALYQQTDVFVFPSFEEGFGLPPLEAMAVGTAVISSNIPVLKETHGNAALFVNPYDPADISEKIYKLYKNKELRLQLGTKGIKQVERFRPTKVREAWLELLEKTIESKK